MNVIEVNGVSKSYGSVKALDEVSFAVGKGEVFGLIGPDGAGKTSMFRILCSLLCPDSGSAMLNGFDTVSQMKAVRRCVGYMPGRFSLYQDLTVRENLEFFATLFGTTVEEGYDGIKAIYQQIERFADRKAGALSGGMKQKLALSCALVHSPEVLLLDEPTTGVDPVSRKELWDMLGSLKERGLTIVASTPYLDEVRRCERVAFLDHGRLRGIGEPEEVLERFADIFNPPGIEHGKSRAAESENVIEVEHLVKAFGSFHAVDDISFSVRRGEIFGFLGANGAGKTTAMHMLTGLNQPTSGSGTVAGYDIRTQHEQIKKHIGYSHQDRRTAGTPAAGRPQKRPRGIASAGLEAEAGLLGGHRTRAGSGVPRRAYGRSRPCHTPPVLGTDLRSSFTGHNGVRYDPLHGRG